MNKKINSKNSLEIKAHKTTSISNLQKSQNVLKMITDLQQDLTYLEVTGDHIL